MNLIAIVATDLNGGIAKNQTIPWHVPEDMRFFKETTENHPIIMGRATYQTLPFALPNRHNIVVSSKPHDHEGFVFVSSLIEAIVEAYEGPYGRGDIFIIGGETLYDQTIEMVDVIYKTVVDTIIDGADKFFPDIDMNKWLSEDISIGNKSVKGLTYSIYKYERIFANEKGNASNY